MGVETILEIQTFDYYDYTRELASRNLLNDWDNDDDITILFEDEVTFPLLSVRGLAASRDISVGEVVIEIPFLSLLSIPTTIDRDPMLSEIMGPSAREKHGWAISSAGSGAQLMEDPEIFSLHELALLAVALLYHKSLGNGSPLEKYVEVLKATPLDSLPFLWSRDKMQHSSLFLHEEIRSVASGLRRDIRDMYKSVVSVLIKEHSEVFTKELLSFSEFEWAFAIVNSRHWQLQIDDLRPEHANTHHKPVRSHAFIEDQSPPAEMPTDAWVLEHEEIDEDDSLDDIPIDLEENEYHASKAFKAASTKHSFLAPVADLLNFGPPCTRGHYNAETKTFQIISTCPFRKGQEVTFWYSDKCDHVMIGMYGFTHPMIPPCPSIGEYRSQLDETRRTIDVFEDVLDDLYTELEATNSALDKAEETLEGCGDCCDYVITPRSKQPVSSGSVRGSHPHDESIIERRRIRMHRDARDSEF
ncbi:hypothetical protein FisN_25Lh133 [Fistulifera solaris]|uniref:Uncharacterized protein n=1 Tax=Fistulifera solaris TaxID=1519565 RepID=A0A1Z5J7T7_FISSO|nr:hypothetical protein FisN_25Lh133 [Fistulifera solaris]|eukprot:GAX10019.1 hypothetical protein FisN_25Lh133 [Fistulifera solaris]